ncbi:MAG: ATP-binding protein [Pseudomonadota bacterium]|nr:ATP-binding protein [Pseudomonadota bacterium]
MGAAAAETDLSHLADLHNQPRRDLQKRLQTAFSAFSTISSQLTHSYLELEQRVDELQSELAETDLARVREHTARAVLAEKLNAVINAMPIAVIILDGKGVVVNANVSAAGLFQDQITGARWIDIIQRHFSPRPADGHEVFLNNGKLVSIATQSLSGEPGQIIVLNDQTETRRLQDKLNHHRKLSEMGKMTASLAHQVRTPLSTAILYADHLASEHLPEDRRLRYAHKLKSRLLLLEQQVRDMLIFSKGGVVLNSVLPVFQLVSVFQAQVEEHCRSGRARVAFAEDIPAGSVRCNPELLTSVFSNLIDNAVEACEGQGIAPCIRVNVVAGKGGLVCFQISDNGPGIDASALDQVQEPFFTTKSTGTGLGLAVVKAVVESHGGQFSITNQASGGVIASLALPQIQGEPEHSEEAK